MYQRTFIDLFTGLQHAVVSLTKDDQESIEAFKQAEQYFPFSIMSVQTDNGGEFRGEFRQWLGRKGIAHCFIPKHSPNWNGTVERPHGVIDQECYLNPLRQWKTLEECLNCCNYERIRLGKQLKGLIPVEKLNLYRQSVGLPVKLSLLNVN